MTRLKKAKEARPAAVAGVRTGVNYLLASGLVAALFPLILLLPSSEKWAGEPLERFLVLLGMIGVAAAAKALRHRGLDIGEILGALALCAFLASPASPLACQMTGSLGGPYGLQGSYTFGDAQGGTCPPLELGEVIPKDYPPHCIHSKGGKLSPEGEKAAGGLLGLIGSWF